VFRGRGGPTDRRLPEHFTSSERRRRRRRAGGDDNGAAVCDDDDDGEQQEIRHKQGHQPALASETAKLEGSASTERAAPSPCNSDDDDDGADNSSSSDGDAVHRDIRQALRARIDRFLQRCENIRYTMRHSKSLDNPSNYQRLVLDAAQNAATEWRNVLAEAKKVAPEVAREREEDHGRDRQCSAVGLDSDRLDSAPHPTSNAADSYKMTDAGRAAFELVQHSLQCGPLSGSKPGYLKRCGRDVAASVLRFLELGIIAPATVVALCGGEDDGACSKTDVSNKDSSIRSDPDPVPTTTATAETAARLSIREAYGWSDKQAAAILKWRDNARNAVEAGKAPSKSILKKQQRQQRKRGSGKSSDQK